MYVTVDGNEAAAFVAHRTSEVIAIYPITPASTMGELADAWSEAGAPNIWGQVPRVIEMQSEAGAAGAVHGSLQAGALTTTFTASQGLLLMLPDMFKLAGELTSAVIHVAARTVATQALSIFGDHSDVMAARTTGFALLCSSSVQEAQDMAAIATMATLEARVPFLHFFDGFRTSHEVAKIERLSEDDLRALIDDDLVAAHRRRALSPDRPFLRGSAQNPDVFFQAREASNSFYLALPGTVQRAMDRFAALTGRQYRLFDYAGDPKAERVLVLMGSGTGAAQEAVARIPGTGVLTVRLFRPFDAAAFCAALPETVRSVAVLDRTKEPGALGEPLYQDVVTAFAEQGRAVRAIGGRYGLASKEFTPAMAASVLAELEAEPPRNHFTVGIVDDVTHTSLDVDRSFRTEADDVVRAVFYGLGSDGTVGANKNSVKIVGEETPLYAQGYFVYDSKKSGSATVSHLRFSPRPISSTYLIEQASFVACHQFRMLERVDVLGVAAPGATFLLNSPFGPDEVWDELPHEVREAIIEKGLRFYVVDAGAVAREAGLGKRVNTVLQTCFFALAEVLPADEAIAAIKHAIEKSYGRRGEVVLERNFAAVDRALDGMHEVQVPTGDRQRLSPSARRGRPHRDADRRPRRPPPRLGAPGRRHVSDRHGALREALDRGGDPDLGSGDLHRLREVRARLPACGDPDEGLRPRGARRRARRLQVEGVALPRPARDADDDPGRPGRLHRLRNLCRDLPREVEGGGAAQVDRPRAEVGAPHRGARAVRVLPPDPGDRPDDGRRRDGEGLADARAAVRVLRRL